MKTSWKTSTENHAGEGAQLITALGYVQTFKHTNWSLHLYGALCVSQCCTCLLHTSSWGHPVGTLAPGSHKRQSQGVTGATSSGGTGLRQW